MFFVCVFFDFSGEFFSISKSEKNYNNNNVRPTKSAPTSNEKRDQGARELKKSHEKCSQPVVKGRMLLALRKRNQRGLCKKRQGFVSPLSPSSRPRKGR